MEIPVKTGKVTVAILKDDWVAVDYCDIQDIKETAENCVNAMIRRLDHEGASNG